MSKRNHKGNYTRTIGEKAPMQTPVLNPKDFDMPDYPCMFVSQQADGSIVGLYLHNNAADYYWLVVKGYDAFKFETLAEARAYCKRKGYTGVGA